MSWVSSTGDRMRSTCRVGQLLPSGRLVPMWNGSSGPSAQEHHIIRTTVALALSSILAGNLRVREEPKGINYAGRKLLVGRIPVGRNPHLLNHCALAMAAFPGFPANLFLRSQTQKPLLASAARFILFQDNCAPKNSRAFSAFGFTVSHDLYVHESRNTQSLFIECSLSHS